jgi:hypothetical protein
MSNEMTFRDPDEAFERAIKDSRLSLDPGQPNYAEDYMYMGTVQTRDGPRDLFKNRLTRKYDV